MYGIDFGTSNTVVTVRERGSTRVLALGDEGIIPSLLFFGKDRKPSIGRSAMEDYAFALAEHGGKAGNLYEKFRFFQAVKLALKDPAFAGTRIFGQFWTAESLAGLFLKEVKRLADAETGRDETRAVFGRPVTLGASPAEDALVESRFARAAEFAGFSEVRFVLEPVGALVSQVWATREGSEESRISLVFDFGGGTLDVSIARVSHRGIEVLANGGEDIGGCLLDEDVSRAKVVGHFGCYGKFRTMKGTWLEMPRWITDQVSSSHALPLADISHTRSAIRDLLPDARPADKPKLRALAAFLDGNLGFSLFESIDACKIELSSRTESAIDFEVPPHIQIRERLSVADFESIIAGRVEDARELVLATMKRAGLTCGEIGAVVRVGGSSRIPAFIRMLDDLFPGKVREGEVFTSIASGLLEAAERGLAAGAAGW